MELFTGTLTNDKIDWTPLETKKNQLLIESVPPIFPGGQKALQKYITNKIRITNIKKNSTIRILARFNINTLGEVTNPTIVKGFSPEVDAEVLLAIASLPNFEPAKDFSGKPKNSNYTLPISIKIKGDEFEIENNSSRRDSIATSNSIQINDGKNTSRPISVEYYLFNSTKLGWINCDRFLDLAPELLTNYSVDPKTMNLPIVKIVFHDIRSVLSNTNTMEKSVFKNVPLNSKITIFIMTIIDGVPHLAVRESIISKELETDFVFKPITKEILEREVIKLNSI